MRTHPVSVIEVVSRALILLTINALDSARRYHEVAGTSSVCSERCV